MDIQIIKKLGQGAEGTVYLAKVKNKKYIYKIEKLNFEAKIAYDRQIEFNDTIAKKYPNKFMTLKSHGIIEDCDHIQPIPEWANAANKKFWEQKNEEKSCSYLMYSPILTGTLDSIHSKLLKNKKLYLDAYKQLVESVNIMRKNGYEHRDLHSKNIMYKKNKSKYEWYIIDYGLINNKKYEQIKHDKNIKKWNPGDLLMLIDWFLNNPIGYVMFKNKIKYPPIKKYINKIKTFTEEYKEIKKYIPKTTNKNAINFAIPSITIILFYDLHMVALGMTDKKYDKYKKTEQLFPDLLLYSIKHSMNKTYNSILKKI